MAARKKAAPKTAAKGRTKKQATVAQLPAGYAPIAGFAPSWEYEQEPLLQGTILSFDEREVERGTGRSKRTETQRLCNIEREDGTQVVVWESAMLRGLFDQCEEGEQVAIAYQGMGKAKPGQNAPKLFAVGYLTE